MLLFDKTIKSNRYKLTLNGSLPNTATSLVGNWVGGPSSIGMDYSE